MMGKSPPLRHPPFYRHQQVIPGHAAAEGEPDGTSAARCGGWEHKKAPFSTMGSRKRGKRLPALHILGERFN